MRDASVSRFVPIMKLNSTFYNDLNCGTPKYIWKSCEIHPCTPDSLGSPQQKGLLRSIAPSPSHVG